MLKLVLRLKHSLIEWRFKMACRQADKMHQLYGRQYRVFRLNRRFVVWSKAEVRILKNRGIIRRGFDMSKAIYKSNSEF